MAPGGEEEGREPAVHGRRRQHRPALGPAVELRQGDRAREDAAENQEGGRERAERGALKAVLPGGRSAEIEEPAERRSGDDVPLGRSRLGEQHDNLREGRGDADDEELRPALPHGDGRGPREDERGEPGPGGAQLAGLQADRGRRERCTDEPEAGDQLGAPGERGDDADRGDACGDDR